MLSFSIIGKEWYGEEDGYGHFSIIGTEWYDEEDGYGQSDKY